jgi:hypothetical protein
VPLFHMCPLHMFYVSTDGLELRSLRQRRRDYLIQSGAAERHTQKRALRLRPAAGIVRGKNI